MPGRDPHPQIALVGDFDARPWADTVVFARGGSDRTLLAAANMQPRYNDLVSFLNGRGLVKSLQERAQFALDGALPASGIVLAVGIDDDDLVYFECDDHNVTLLAGAANARLGFPTGASTAGSGGGPYRATAPADWLRGPFWSGDLTLRIATTPATDIVFGTCGYVQDVPTYLRSSNFVTPTVDEDALTTGLEATLQRTDGGDLLDIHWGLDAAGKVFASYPTVWGSVAWASDSFRQALGFTGTESPVVVGSYSLLTATHQAPCVWLPYRSLGRLERGLVEDGSVSRADDGSYAGVHRGSHERLWLDLWIDGPADETGPAQRNHDRHFLRWLRANPTGSRVTFYQHWGDPRRELGTVDVDVDRQAYSLTRTSEYDGRRGRVICYRAPGLEEHRTHYEHVIQAGAPVTLTLDVAE